VNQLEEHSQQGLVEDGNYLGGSRGGSSKQIRMALERGPMHSLGCGLNQELRVKNSRKIHAVDGTFNSFNTAGPQHCWSGVRKNIQHVKQQQQSAAAVFFDTHDPRQLSGKTVKLSLLRKLYLDYT